ncbi:ArsR family transcriptional regulator [Nanoarchaeota archaeon]
MVVIRHQKITIVKVGQPERQNINQELQFLGLSLGLFNLRDKEKSCFRIFIELVKAAKLNQPLSSDEMAEKLGITRGTVVHHLNKLMDSGLVISRGNRYMLRVDNLKELVDILESDVKKTLSSLRDIAEDVDKQLGL